MNHNAPDHLSYDEQLKAMVDLSDLPVERQHHLKICDICHAEVQAIARRYHLLGKAAQALAPSPRRPFRMPQHAQPKTRYRYYTLWATGAVAALVLMVLILHPTTFAPSTSLAPVSAERLEADRRLMVQIDALIEDALPEPFRELAALPEPRPEFDEDLINRIVPSIEENDSLS